MADVKIAVTSDSAAASDGTMKCAFIRRSELQLVIAKHTFMLGLEKQRNAWKSDGCRDPRRQLHNCSFVFMLPQLIPSISK